MAVRFDATTDRFLRTTDLLDYNSPYTIMGHVYFAVNTGGAASFFSINDNTAANSDQLRTGATGVVLQVRVINASAASQPNGSTLTAGTWYHLAIVREGAAVCKAYLDGNLDSTNTQDTTSRTSATRFEVAQHRSNDGQPANIRVYALKAWSAALTQQEVQAERYAIRPLRLANLYAYWPVRSDTSRAKDLSGNGRDWTEGGTLTDEDGFPVSWGICSGRKIFIVAGGVTYNQSIDVSMASTLLLLKQVNKNVNSANSPTVSLVKQSNKHIPITNLSALSLLKQANKNISATSASAITRVSQINKHVSSSTTAEVTTMRQMNKVLAFVQSSVVSRIAAIQKQLTFTQPVTATITKQINKLLALAQAGTVTIDATRVYLREIAITAVSSVSLSRHVNKIVSSTAMSATTITRSIGKIVAVSATNTTQLTKAITKAITVTASSLVSLATEFIAGSVTFQTLYRNVRSVSLTVRNIGSIAITRITNNISLRGSDDGEL